MMKFSENWLRIFVNPPLTTRALAEALTMAGVEVEALEPVAPPFDKVVVAEVLSVRKHPDADRLTVCEVEAGGDAPLAVVCGAPNVRAGMKAPLALPGARLPGGLSIKVAKVRGIESRGMLCSSKELGLNAAAAGLLALPEDAPVGTDIRKYLDLDDQLLTLKPTPNRSDCLSVHGVAREVAAVTGVTLTPLRIKPCPVRVSDRLEVKLDAPQACPRYCGRVVRGVNAKAMTPAWMVRRLERSGLRPISAVVDITNYVMLELGQPLHAFDLARLKGGIHVRFAHADEKLTLLNDQTPALDHRFLVIADEARAVALAGIMGGVETAVGAETRDIFLESAFFVPEVIAGKSRVLGFGSDSSYRFERGVDFAGTAVALERATQLVLEVCGGEAGAITEARADPPKREPIRLRLARARRLLGVSLSATHAADVFRRLRFEFTAHEEVFTVTPPSYRFDLALEEDLIEELARIHGYDNIPAATPAAPSSMLPVPETRRPPAALRELMALRDYQEIVSYSFVDEEWERDLCGNAQPIALANPIARQMGVMRSSLAGSLIACLCFNLAHRQPRVRLFELSRCFVSDGGKYAQPLRLGALACGDALPEQWGAPARRVDFYDVKADVDALLWPRTAQFEAAQHPALHPGKSAHIVIDGKTAGWLGELHPRWQQKYDLPLAPVLFELDLDALAARELPACQEVSKFPLVRRDLAVIVDESVGGSTLLAALQQDRPAVVTDIGVFDVYRGTGVETGKKSLAFRVLLQDTHKTLTDAEVDTAVSQLVRILQKQFDAKLR